MRYRDFCAGAKYFPAGWQAVPDDAGPLVVSAKVITLSYLCECTGDSVAENAANREGKNGDVRLEKGNDRDFSWREVKLRVERALRRRKATLRTHRRYGDLESQPFAGFKKSENPPFVASPKIDF
jgi:hypothetical protein